MKGSKLILLLVALIMSTAVLAISWPESTSYVHAASLTRNATPSTSGSAVSSMIIPPQVAAATSAYWTPARMRAAIRAARNLAPAVAPQTQAALTGTPKAVPPVALLRPLTTTMEATGTPSPHYKYPFPFKRFEVNPSLYAQLPYSTIGIVFAINPRTRQFQVCSGTAVNSKNLSVVDTAGHCVIEGGSGNNWYTKWIFCPAYHDGTCPLGMWTARLFWSHSNWIKKGYFEYDYGEAVMSTNKESQLVSRVGGMEVAWNYSRNQFFHALGYPVAPPFTGANRMFECQAPYGANFSPNKVSPAAMGIGCDMTGGASGGGWLIQIRGRWYVNGHNDFYSQPFTMCSPYYGNAWFSIFDLAQKS